MASDMGWMPDEELVSDAEATCWDALRDEEHLDVLECIGTLVFLEQAVPGLSSYDRECLTIAAYGRMEEVEERLDRLTGVILRALNAEGELDGDQRQSVVDALKEREQVELQAVGMRALGHEPSVGVESSMMAFHALVHPQLGTLASIIGDFRWRAKWASPCYRDQLWWWMGDVVSA